MANASSVQPSVVSAGACNTLCIQQPVLPTNYNDIVLYTQSILLYYSFSRPLTAAISHLRFWLWLLWLSPVAQTLLICCQDDHLASNNTTPHSSTRQTRFTRGPDLIQGDCVQLKGLNVRPELPVINTLSVTVNLDYTDDDQHCELAQVLVKHIEFFFSASTHSV